MRLRPPSTTANPLIGVYFSIFAALMAAAVILLLILEQLGTREASLRIAMALVALVMFACVGAGAYTARPAEFLYAARRVPAFYGGLSLAVVALGGVGLAGLAGGLFLTGFDMLCLGLGVIAGLTASVLLIAPFLRKYGAPTVPGYLGARFESGPVRVIAAAAAVVPLVLLAIAETKIAIVALNWLMPLSPSFAAGAIGLAVAATVVAGGVRSLSWSSAAQALAVLVAILLPATIAAIMETNLPFGQLSHGPLLRAVTRAEAVQSVPVPVAGLLAVDLPVLGLQPIAGRFQTAFGSIGLVAFPLLTLSVLAGIAGSPGLLSRALTAPTVFETRKSIGWAVVLTGIVLTTLSAVAVFERTYLLGIVGAPGASVLPASLQQLVELGIARVDGQGGRPTAIGIQFERDGLLLALPVIMGMPRAVVNLVAAGLLAAALAASALAVTQIGVILGEDVINGPRSWRVGDQIRLNVCRLGMIGAAALASAAAAMLPGDPLLLMLTALALSGSGLFPVLVLSIWWKRMTAAGAVATLVTGVVGALGVILAADLGLLALPAVLAPVVAVPLAAGVGMLVSHLTPVPGRHILEAVRDLRIPGGETIHDREERIARQRSAKPR